MSVAFLFNLQQPRLFACIAFEKMFAVTSHGNFLWLVLFLITGKCHPEHSEGSLA
jgi:hypothetical protein